MPQYLNRCDVSEEGAGLESRLKQEDSITIEFASNTSATISTKGFSELCQVVTRQKHNAAGHQSLALLSVIYFVDAYFLDKADIEVVQFKDDRLAPKQLVCC